MDITQQNVSTIASTKDQILAQPEAYSAHYIPSVVVSATKATTPSGLAHSAVDHQLDKIEGMFQQILQQQQNRLHQSNPNGGTRHNNRSGRGTVRGDPNGPWRQWKYWCYSCGTNLSHNSQDCHRTKIQLPDHQRYKSIATKENPQGGNSRKDHLWLKWCDPGTYEPRDTKGGE
uniref:Uncharacterized protein n=1 Tax=Pseudo-nitzschia australis TaxID=44445 RepID=A0A7S4ASS5_9STRA